MTTVPDPSVLHVARHADVYAVSEQIGQLFQAAMGWKEPGPLTVTLSEAAAAHLALLRTNLAAVMPPAGSFLATPHCRGYAYVNHPQLRDVYLGEMYMTFPIPGTTSQWHAGHPFSYDPITRQVLAIAPASEDALASWGPVCITRRNKNWSAIHLEGDQAAADRALAVTAAAIGKLRKLGWAPPASGVVAILPDVAFDTSEGGQHQYADADFSGVGGYAHRGNRRLTLPARTMSQPPLTYLVAHELVHLSGPLGIGDLAPSWLEEGVCELVARRACPASAALPGLPSGLHLTARHIWDLRDADLAAWAEWDPRATYDPYALGRRACAVLADTHGLPAMRKLLILARRVDIGTALQGALGLSVAEVEQQLHQAGDRAWDAHVEKERLKQVADDAEQAAPPALGV